MSKHYVEGANQNPLIEFPVAIFSCVIRYLMELSTPMMFSISALVGLLLQSPILFLVGVAITIAGAFWKADQKITEMIKPENQSSEARMI